MNARLQALCDRMIENREVLRGALRWENDRFYPVCANMFCVRGLTPDPERLKAARGLLRAETGLFSNLRGHVSLPLICALSMEEDPAARLAALPADEGGAPLPHLGGGQPLRRHPGLLPPGR